MTTPVGSTQLSRRAAPRKSSAIPTSAVEFFPHIARPSIPTVEFFINNWRLSMEEKTKTATGAVAGGVVGGVAGGAAAGAAVGGMTGPVGAAVGAVVGAAVGAMTGKAIKADPVAEDRYWRDNYQSRPYVENSTYDDFGPAYAYGVHSHSRYPGRTFDEVEADLGRDWSTTRGSSTLGWDRAKHASRDAWQRVSDSVERAIPGDSDRDGR